MSDDDERIYRVRPLEKSDIGVLSAWFNDLDDLSVFDRTLRVPLGREASEAAWSDALGNDGKSGKYWFAIDDPTSKIGGIVGLENVSAINGDAVLPLYIDRPLRRQGVGVRAAALIADLAFRQLGLNRITSYFRADNEGSMRLTARVGFQVEGRLRQAWFSNGRRSDMIVVGLLKDDWMSRRAGLSAELVGKTAVGFGRAGSAGWRWPLSEEVG